jgi:hypothetical protein
LNEDKEGKSKFGLTVIVVPGLLARPVTVFVVQILSDALPAPEAAESVSMAIVFQGY